MNCARGFLRLLTIALPVILIGSFAIAAPPLSSESSAVSPGTAPAPGAPTMAPSQSTDTEALSTELMTAAGRGDTRRVSELLRQGANVRMRNQTGETPLMVAALHGHEQTFQLLLEQGADVNSVNSEGISILAAAAHAGKPEIVKMLLGHGAIDKDGKAMAFAKQSGREDVIKLLSPTAKLNEKGIPAVVTKVDRPEGCLRIRIGPSSSTEKIACAATGDKLSLSGVVQKGWAQVESATSGRAGGLNS
jgi:uncharacterized protein